jgi:hypothetical protein
MPDISLTASNLTKLSKVELVRLVMRLDQDLTLTRDLLEQVLELIPVRDSQI